MKIESNTLGGHGRGEIGMFAVSKSGHDRGRLYVIIRENDEYVYLADGRLRMFEQPKKKNRKHIQIIHRQIEEDILVRLLNGEMVHNDKIKRAIKLYEMDKV